MTLSPLAPDSFPDLPPIAGITLGTAASGMRYQGRDDLLLISLAPESSVAGVFTQSDTAAAPVGWSRKIVETGTAAAIITNAGNANALPAAAAMMPFMKWSIILPAILIVMLARSWWPRPA